MKDETIVSIVAIIGLVVLEAINIIVTRYDSGIILAIGAIIGGIAGYEFKGWQLARSRGEEHG